MKQLVVYNICGLNSNTDNVSNYQLSLDSILNQDFTDYKVVVSSCCSKKEHIDRLKRRYGKRISYILYNDVYPVNITFNRSVQLFKEHIPNIESFMYVDSGINFNSRHGEEQTNILLLAYNCFKEHNDSLIYVQATSDEGYNYLLKEDGSGKTYRSSTPKLQIKNKDFEIPLGTAANLHVCIFSDKIYNSFDKKLLPDVFYQNCSESVLRYIAAACNISWFIMKDKQVQHIKAIDGPSMCCDYPDALLDALGGPMTLTGKHHNRLLFNRSALDFINDPEFIKSGAGYEECNNIAPYNPEAYDENNKIKNINLLRRMIKKYFYLNNKELDYNTIPTQYFLY
tara:strand:+ start:4401 stop:5420 length:1020 start_codon:yes stop_codon:yes gene_type:complete